MTTFKRECTECGDAFIGKKAHAEFCSTACRKNFNNRRAMRGAQLYDAMMNLRYARADAKVNDIDYTFLCRMAEKFNRDDEILREGRRSYRKAQDVTADLGAVVNARHGDQAAKHLRTKGKARTEAKAAISAAQGTDAANAATLLREAKKALAAKEASRLVGFEL